MRASIRYLAVAALAAAVTSAVMATTGQASSDRTATKNYTLKPGSYVRFVGIDLSCLYQPNDPDHHDPGPALFCNRYSANNSRSFGASNYHYRVSDPAGNHWITTINRSP